jgi:hypothetical protein
MTDWPSEFPSIEELQVVIDATTDGEYELREIYGFIWDEFPRPTEFSHNFKHAVKMVHSVTLPT